MGIWRQVEEQQAICRRIEQRLGILPSTEVQRLEIAPVDMPATAHASELGRVTVDVLQKAFAASEAWERFKQYSPEAAAEAARTAPVDSGDKGATLYREMRIARKRTADLPRAINDAIDRADAALAEKNAREAVDDAERPRGRARKQAADEDILKL